MEPTKNRKSSFLKRADPPVGKILGGKYRYIKVLGTGGMGEVHLVEDIENGQRLAMKCCNEEKSAERFEREVLSWMKVSRHPNLVMAIYFDRIESVPTLFIEYVEGTNLKAVIEESAEEKKDIPLKVVLDYAIQICRGMAHLHRHGIIHRDLKPSNIMIASEEEGPGRIKITDMGLSKVKGTSDLVIPAVGEGEFVLPDITHTRDMLGTPQYMSPQQYAYSKGVAEETDIYAFGVILYEMLTRGKRPFNAVNSQGWFYAHTFKEPRHVKSQLSSRFAIFQRKSRNDLYDLVMQCLSKKISERPQSFRELEDKLSELYQKICNETYTRDRYWKATGMSYEEMNNQAVSLLEMGDPYVKEGWEKLNKVCKCFPEGTEANLNRLLFQLRSDECSLAHFWHQGRKLLAERPHDRQKIITALAEASIEKGGYYHQAMELLQSVSGEQSVQLRRVKAKLLYLGEHYQQALEIFENLCGEDYSQKEDFYHWAGSLIHLALKDQKARLCIEQNIFSVDLEKTVKQKTWYIIRKGEDKCGESPFFERGKDIAIGGPVSMDSFWHESQVLTMREGEIRCIAISADQAYLLAGCEDGVSLWELEHLRTLCCLKGHGDMVSDVAIDWEGRYGISGSRDGRVCIWDLIAQKLLGTFEHGAVVTQVAMNSDKGLAVSAGTDGCVRIWNLNVLGRKKLRQILMRRLLSCFSPDRGEIAAIAMSLDAHSLLAGCKDGSVLAFDLESPRKPYLCLRGHPGPITRLSISADGKWAISSSNSYSDNIFIWDLEKKEKLLSFSAAKHGILSMAVGGNAYWLFSASDNGSIALWDLKYRKCKVGTLEGHTGKICDLAATFQGDLALSCGTDGTIRMWRNDYLWPIIRSPRYFKVVPQ